MLINRGFHVLQAEEGGGGTGGGGSVDSGAAGAGGGAAGAAGAGGGDPGAGGSTGAASALAAGAAAAGAGAGTGGGAAPPDPLAWLPEKHRVAKADGSGVDIEASAKKVAEGYAHLERRLGSGDAPPALATDYKITVPEALKDKINAEELGKSADFQGFLGKLHAAGLNQKQADLVAGEMLARGVALREAMPVLAQAECEATLRADEAWKTDQQYSKQISTAFQAGSQIFGKDFEGLVKDYGNDPRFIRGLASIGAEMAEDAPPSAEAQAQVAENIDQLMSNPAYLNPNDPKHADIVAKVSALTKQQVGTRNVNGGRSNTFLTG